jgi:hypothetical protein
MKALKYMIPFISLITNCWGQITMDTIRVHNTPFIFQQKTLKSEYKHIDTVVYVYRIENGQKKYLLKHYTYRFSADCNNEFIDKGDYTIQSDTFIFTTRYLQNLSDPIPLRRKQIYVVKPTGKLILIKDMEQDHAGVWRNTASMGN